MKKTLLSSLTCITTAALVSACGSTSAPVETLLTFEQVSTEVIPFENRNRRKWDNPLVADLDKDGWPDIVTTDHGSSLSIYWNNQGTFSDPYIPLKKDTHGVSVADYDNDGLMEIIVVQGGGNGKHPKFPIVFEVSKQRKVTKTEPFKHFEFTRGRASKFIDSDNDGTLEFIQTGFPLNIQQKGANFLYTLDENNVYQYQAHLPQAQWLGYKSTLVDYNNDGDMDVLFYGGKDMILVEGGKGHSFTNVTQNALLENANTPDVSSVTPFDYDNDGDFDLLLTRANHQFKHHSFYDENTQRFAFFTFKKPVLWPDLQVEGDLVITNLQQAHPDFDLFYGANKNKVEFDVDLHGHKDVQLTQEQAQGWPEDRKASGIYIGYLGDNKWRIHDKTRSRSAAVIENVISPVDVASIKEMPLKLLENQNGVYVDVTEQFNLNISEQTKSAVAADFNNDGWTDLFVVRYGNMATKNEQLLYLNQQGNDFELQTDVNIVSNEIGATGSGAEPIDFDKDGDIDLVYANERGKWHLFENKLVSNNRSLTVSVSHSEHKLGTYMGAKVSITACGTTQTKVIGYSSAPFSQNADLNLHFGLGECKQDAELQIVWSDLTKFSTSIAADKSNLSVGVNI